jgi:hypothetical protein
MLGQNLRLRGRANMAVKTRIGKIVEKPRTRSVRLSEALKKEYGKLREYEGRVIREKREKRRKR